MNFIDAMGLLVALLSEARRVEISTAADGQALDYIQHLGRRDGAVAMEHQAWGVA
ncbi:MAG TPA: hypothetical protein VGR22_11825 [Thermomicrobiales bacterium]|nr:hypothetical protein [Thermomicrobiales bacterium]